MSIYTPVTDEPLSCAERKLAHAKFLLLRDIEKAAAANDDAEVKRLTALLP